MDGGSGGMMPMSRSGHPPLSAGAVPVGVAVAPLSSNLPTAKISSSSYPSGMKFHSSHSANPVTEVQQYSNSSGGANSSSSHSKNSQENDAQAQDPSVQFPRHRVHRRTKDQDAAASKANSSSLPSVREPAPASNMQYNRGVQFDLEASAFPPLPGLDAESNKLHNPPTESNANDSASQSQNRLSDVVKGTAKFKSTKEKV